MKKKNLWIITDEPHGIGNAVTIRPGRRSPTRISEVLEQLWVDRYLTFREKIDYLNKRKKIPYKSEFHGYGSIPYGGRIMCGYTNAELMAVYSFEHEETKEWIEFRYRLPTKQDDETRKILEWKTLSLKVINPNQALQTTATSRRV